MNRLSGLRTPASSKKAKTASKLDEHVERSGLDSVDRFIDPTTNVIYHKLKTLGKGGFAKGRVCWVLCSLIQYLLSSVPMPPRPTIPGDRQRCRA